MGIVKKGKILFLTMAIIFVLSDLLVTFINCDMLEISEIGSSVIRIIVEVFLLGCIYDGSNVARIILVICSILGIIVGLYVLVNSKVTVAKLLMAYELALYLWSAYIMMFSPSFKAYLSSLKDDD